MNYHKEKIGVSPIFAANILRNEPSFQSIEGYRGPKIDSLFDSNGLPSRIRNRLFLMEAGFCRMYTCVVPPEVNVGMDEVRRIAREASLVNKRIGLSKTVNSVVIRTRDVPFRRFNGSDNSKFVRLGGTNPMLIINNLAQDWPKMTSSSWERGIEDYTNILDGIASWRHNMARSYLLIHEENSEAQRRSIHGRVGELGDGSHEISIGKGVDHARMLGDNGYPYVSVAGHDFEFSLEMLANLRGQGYFGAKSNDWSVAGELASGVLAHANTLRNALSAVKKHAGENRVLEFRLYRGKESEAGLQIYDFD